MSLASNILLSLHIICGFVSLVLFWVPVMVKKGGKIHRQVGNWYVYTMAVVAGSAFILSIENLLTDRVTLGIFLGYLSLLTARPLLLGIECLTSKKELKARYKYWHMSTSTLVAVLGVGLIYFGLTSPSDLATVFVIFGVLGMTALRDMFSLLRAEFKGSGKWLEDHIANMCIAGIAAHTAFLVFGGQSFLPDSQSQVVSIIMWSLPTVVGVIGIKWAKGKYVKSKVKPKAKVA